MPRPNPSAMYTGVRRAGRPPFSLSTIVIPSAARDLLFRFPRPSFRPQGEISLSISSFCLLVSGFAFPRLTALHSPRGWRTLTPIQKAVSRAKPLQRARRAEGVESLLGKENICLRLGRSSWRALLYFSLDRALTMLTFLDFLRSASQFRLKS